MNLDFGRLWPVRSQESGRVRRPTRRPQVEGLESRELLTAAVPDIAMTSATTADSRSITFNYQIKNAPVTQPFQFGVYRSADPTFDATDIPVDTMAVVPAGQPGATLDQYGIAAASQGDHKITLDLPNGLPPDPQHPYVLVVADPQKALTESDTSNNTASIHTHVIGVITHGGVQPKKWDRTGPPWERRLAAKLVADGYDAVIPFNWVSQSGNPGSAALEGPRLAAKVLSVASQFPATDPVDVHFIGHSEGTVVNSQAILSLNASGWTPSMRAGYLKVTMLDPHAANNGVPGQQYSVSNGILGHLARLEINDYQSRAKDPVPVIPSNVDDAEVFFQRTPVRQSGGSNHGIYNLWGQVPVHGQARYYNLTAPGMSHAGKFSVPDWYLINVAPSLGSGETYVRSAALTGEQVGLITPATYRRIGQQVSYTGTGAPGAIVRIIVAKPTEKESRVVGRGLVHADGTWNITSRPLGVGHYKVIAESNVPSHLGQRPAFMKPITWLGWLSVTSRLQQT